MLRLIPPGKSLKFYVLLSWLIPTGLGILASVMVFFVVSFYGYRSNLQQAKNDLANKCQIVARRLSAELLIGQRGSVSSVSRLLQDEMALSSVSLSSVTPPCTVQEIGCSVASGGNIISYTKIPYTKEPFYAVVENKAPKFEDSVRRENLLWSTLPILLILGIGLVFQRMILKSFFLWPVQHLIETTVGDAEPRKHWPKEIREISEKLYKSFEDRDTEVFSKIARGVFHDLRTLIHGPICAVELIKEQPQQAQKRETLLENLYQATSAQLPKMKAIVDNALDGSRDIELAPISTNINKTVKSAIETLTTFADQSNTKISLEESDNEFVHDPMQLERALTNIIKNGIEATAQTSRNTKPEVSIKIHPDKNATTIEIEDTGPGLPTTSDKAFRLLKSNKPNGSGLGLMVSKKIIEAHRGTIEIARSSHLKGAKFRIILPHVSREVVQ